MNQHKDYGRKKFISELDEACLKYALHGIRNHGARVEMHFAISNVIFEFQTGKIQTGVVARPSDYKYFDEILSIHNKSQKVTAHLNKLGYKDDLKGDEWDKLAVKMRNALIKLFGIKLDIAKREKKVFYPYDPNRCG